MRKLTTSIIGLSAAAALTLTGCSTTQNDSGDSGSGGDSDLATDFGVTDDAITIGVLTDLSGVFKVGGLGQTQGNEMWVKHINEEGGICGRDVVLDIQDHGYLPDKALPLYDAQKDKVVGNMQLLGSPILAALKQRLTNDQMLAIPGSWASANLDSPYVFMLAASYDVEAINGLAYFMEQGKIAEGDKVGLIYVDSEYGQNSLLGAKYYAEKHDLQIVEAAVSASDSDMTATITKFRAEGVSAIFMATTPAAAGSAALQVQAQGLNVPLIGNSPTWIPSMVNDPSLAEAGKNYWLISTVNSFSSDNQFIKDLLAEYQDNYTEKPYEAVLLGYAQGMAWGEVLQTACDNGDMTRPGLLEAKQSITGFNAEGILTEHDFTTPGAPGTRDIFIVQPEVDSVSGNKLIEADYTSDEAQEYKAPYQK